MESRELNATSTTEGPRSGYDIPIYGLDNGTFYAIHIPAIICIVASFVCALVAIVLSFRRKPANTFFTKWSKSEKFVVYLAICDGLFNVSHFTDHFHIAVAEDMVHPKELCEFYGFNLTVFISAQNLMVNVVSVNAFVLIYFDKNIKFGRRDWRLLLWTFGVPVIGATVAWATGQLGPNGAYCYFDEIKGRIAKIFFTSVPLFSVLVINTILYILTWSQIYRQTRDIRAGLAATSSHRRATHRAARSMSMFVAAFIIQWWPMTLYGVWTLFDNNIPQPIVHLVTIFSNLGGVLNLCVLFIIRRKHLFREESGATTVADNTRRQNDTSLTPV